jgi:hypothetical protein
LSKNPARREKMSEILSIDNGERRERVNRNLREFLHQNSYGKESNLRLTIFVVVMSWFIGYGVWTFANDIIKLIF